MSFIRLLSMGRCLKKTENQTGVYREATGSLPRFDTQSALPASPTLPPSRSLVTGEPSLFSRLVAGPTGEEFSASSQQKRAATPAAVAPKPATVAPARTVALPSPIIPAGPRRENKWLSKIKQLLGIRQKPQIERHVQIELALDRVKVVRNDLTESDLVVVERKAQSADTTSMLTSFERRRPQSWMKATKRIFRPFGTTTTPPADRSPFKATQPAPDLIPRT